MEKDNGLDGMRSLEIFKVPRISFQLKGWPPTLLVLHLEGAEALGQVELPLHLCIGFHQCQDLIMRKSHLSKEQVCDEEYLGGAVDQVDGEVVVGVGRVVVDPQLPGDGGEDGGGEQHAARDEGLLHEGEQVCKERQEGEEEADVTNTGIGLENTSQADQGGRQQQWLSRKP